MLDKYIDFEPIAAIYSNVWNKSSKNCLGGGKYCTSSLYSENPDVYVPGNQIMKEILRQKCIYKVSGNDWFEYMKSYKEKCFYSVSRMCSSNLLDSANIRHKNINECMKFSDIHSEHDSAIKDSMNDVEYENGLLDRELKKVRDLHEMSFPVLYINGQQFKGHVKTIEILNDICGRFDFKPQACNEVQMMYDHESKHFSILQSLIGDLIILFVGLGLIAWCCMVLSRRNANRMADNEVNRLVQEYIVCKQEDKEIKA